MKEGLHRGLGKERVAGAVAPAGIGVLAPALRTTLGRGVLPCGKGGN